MSEFHHTFYVEATEVCIEIECTLAYHPAEGDGWHLPRHPESAELISARIGNVDISKALTDDQVAAIEQDALTDRGNEMAEQAAEARWEQRIGAYD